VYTANQQRLAKPGSLRGSETALGQKSHKTSEGADSLSPPKNKQKAGIRQKAIGAISV
jgi:hypothetical protein